MNKNTPKNAQLTIKTVYPQEEESDFFTEADCFVEPDGSLRMEYSESLMSMNDTKTVMRLYQDSVSIERSREKGEGTTFMFFQQNKTHQGKYYTEVGEMNICIYTSRLNTTRTENEAEAVIDYSMQFCDLNAGAMKIKISARY